MRYKVIARRVNKLGDELARLVFLVEGDNLKDAYEKAQKEANTALGLTGRWRPNANIAMTELDSEGKLIDHIF